MLNINLKVKFIFQCTYYMQSFKVSAKWYEQLVNEVAGHGLAFFYVKMKFVLNKNDNCKVFWCVIFVFSDP